MTELQTTEIELDGKTYVVKYYEKSVENNPNTNEKINDEAKKEIERRYKEIIWEKYTQVVIDILDGKYGNGDERKKKLKASGYDYDFAQCIVNYLLLG